ncbi:MAG: type II toxin-antitoxin system RelE/ParE family toxin [Rhodobacterales bacterium CG15_BIG_FIL_POST_REV_8_21_14_020_59_13]|nr:MAG: type II toxin-antitoxin system RelE/ParE family toxin [Rhodobacterales bacterium CG15_BIG_FIL_POST_REV_8_21_14_020_59_13]
MHLLRYIRFGRGAGSLADADKNIEVVFYRTVSGNEPVRDWLKSDVSEADRKRIGTDIKAAEYGWPIGMPVCRPMGDGLHEIRSSLPGKRIARVLFCVEGGRMVLLHGFIKKTPKTPKAELDLAKNRKKEISG